MYVVCIVTCYERILCSMHRRPLIVESISRVQNLAESQNATYLFSSRITHSCQLILRLNIEMCKVGKLMTVLVSV